MNIGKSKSKGAMGARRDFGLAGGNGKGSRSRTNTASPRYQQGFCDALGDFPALDREAQELEMRKDGFVQKSPGKFTKRFK